MTSRMGDLQDHKDTSSSFSASKDGGVCSNCGCAENNVNTPSSSTASSSSSTHSPTNGGHGSTPTSPHKPFASDSRCRYKFVSKRSESCTDLNGNSRSSNSTNRRAPNLASLSKNITAVRPFSISLDAGPGSTSGSVRSERIHETKVCAKDQPVLYLTPLQRKEREGREMKREISRLYNELSQKDERIYQLQSQLEDQAKDYRDELERRIAEIQDLMEEKERLMDAAREEKIAMEEEIGKMDQMFTDLKVKHTLQEDQFQERYLDMYKRGQKAAMFEREQELEMIATSKQPKVTVRELTRKLSMTESELAKWQTLRLDETYHKSADQPLTDADVTLSFLKDSFYHFVCDKDDCLRHFRAIVEIFHYSDTQMHKIRKTVSESKDFGRLFRKETG